LIKISKKIYATTFIALLISLITISSTSILLVKSSPGTMVNIDPSSLTWGTPGHPIPQGKFSITIDVTDVTELFTWQFKLFYNASVIDITNPLAGGDVFLPSDHVFAGKGSFQFLVNTGTESGLKFVIVTACLSDPTYFFSGSGKLCVINFTAQNQGTTDLKFSRPLSGEDPDDLMNGDTYLWETTSYPNDWADPSTFVIKFGVNEGTVTVYGETVVKLPSTITISATPLDVYVGQSITFEGEIQEQVPNAPVHILIRVSGEATFSTELANVATDDVGAYQYIWKPTMTDLEKPLVQVFELQASWEGNENYYNDTSNTVSVTVRKPSSFITIQGPPFSQWGDESLDPPTSPFNITINVKFATNITAWQIRLYYVSKYVEAINVTFPSNHVFSGETFSNSSLIEPSYNATHGYIFCNASLALGEEPFTGNGTLIRIFFRGIYADQVYQSRQNLRSYLYGISPLIFDQAETHIWNSTGQDTYPLPPEGASITIIAKIKVLSTLSIYLDPSSLVLGDFTTIEGTISLTDNSKRSNASILIMYRILGEDWQNLTITQTDSQSNYKVEWRPPNATGYEVKTKWFGDNQTASDESDVATLTVTTIGSQTENEMDLFPIASIVVVVYIVAMSIVILKRTKEE
jgi:hypothetical protein